MAKKTSARTFGSRNSSVSRLRMSSCCSPERDWAKIGRRRSAAARAIRISPRNATTSQRLMPMPGWSQAAGPAGARAHATSSRLPARPPVPPLRALLRQSRPLEFAVPDRYRRRANVAQPACDLLRDGDRAMLASRAAKANGQSASALVAEPWMTSSRNCVTSSTKRLVIGFSRTKSRTSPSRPLSGRRRSM